MPAKAKTASPYDQASATSGLEAGKCVAITMASRNTALRKLNQSFNIRNSALGISPIHHLAPQGMARLVLANGSMSSNQSGVCPARRASSKPKAKPQSLPRQRDIRLAPIEAVLVDCMRNKVFSSATEKNCLAIPS